MTTMVQNPEVRAYLDDLQQALSGRPPAERDLVLDGVRQHIEDALGAGPADPEHVRRVLDDLGDPVAIAAESADPQDGTASVVPAPVPLLDRRRGAVLTVLVLAFGGIVVPVLGWIVGIVLLWTSRGWRTADKIVGTVAPAAGAVAGLLLAWGLTALGVLDGWAHLAVLVGLLIGVVFGTVRLLVRFRPLG